MPEDESGDQGFIPETPSTAHDDIMKRLLAYQERLRQDIGAQEAPPRPSPWAVPEQTSASEAPSAPDVQPVTTATEDLVDVGSAEDTRPGAPVRLPPAPAHELDARVAELEATLERVDAMLGDLRRRFQDLAIAADERIAAIQDQIARVRGRAGAS